MKIIVFLLWLGILEITAKSAARFFCNPLSCGDTNVWMSYNSLYHFSSPGYPSPYPTSTVCLWEIHSPFLTALRLQCYFDTTPSSNCALDPFYFSQSGDCLMNDGRAYCGLGYLDLTTQASSLVVSFASQAANYKHQGFTCQVSVMFPFGAFELLTPDPNPPPGSSSLTSPFVTSNPNPSPGSSSLTSPFVTSNPNPSPGSSSLTSPFVTSNPNPPPGSSSLTSPFVTSKTSTPGTYSEMSSSKTPFVTNSPVISNLASSVTTGPATNASTGIPSNSSCECGIKGSSRIVGGNEAESLEWHWQVGLTRAIDGSTFCGGSLIGDQWFVTAAHCVEGRSASQLNVILGDHDTSVIETTELTLNVDEIIMHGNYDEDTVDNDIALLHLLTPVGPSADERITPICLPANYNSEDFIEEIATVTGRGTLQYQGAQSSVLMEVALPIVDCQDFEIRAGAVTNNMICAYEVGKDSCQGDSGGPLQLQLNGKYYLVGLVSFGHGCGDLNSPGVYTKVTNYINWIEDNTGEKFCY